MDDLCDIDRNLIEEELRGLGSTGEMREYFLKVCEFYSERVAILMRVIYRSQQQEIAAAQILQERESRYSRLARELEENKIFENRLKELEIENTQLKKFKSRFEEAEGKNRALEKKLGYYKDLFESREEALGELAFDDLLEWERRCFRLLERLRDKKTELCQAYLMKPTAVPKCIVCQVNPVNTILRDCNHVCLCLECSKTVEKCPFDRKRITAIERIYLP